MPTSQFALPPPIGAGLGGYKGEAAYSAALLALKVGYRHLDTAEQ